MRGIDLFRRLRTSFKAKVFGLTFSFVITLSVIIPTFFITYEIRHNYSALINEGMILSKLLAYNSRLPLFSENDAMLDEVADSLLIHRNVRSVAIYAADGRKLIEELTGEVHVPLVDNPEERRQVSGLARTLSRVMHVDRKHEIEFWVPVRLIPGFATDEDLYFGTMDATKHEMTIGVGRITVSTDDLWKTARILIGASVLSALFFLAAGTAVAYLVARSVTRPLKRLAANVTALGTEQTLHEIPVETGDEVGKVAVAFNGLIDSLRRREKEKAFLEEQLRQSQKIEAVGTLAGGIAHDFNTILTAIIGFADMVKKETGDQNVLNHVAQIRSSAGRASQLVSRLMAFSRKQEIDPRPADLNDVILHVGELLRQVATGQVSVDLALSPEPLPVLVDAGQIDQVLLNLTANARDAMPGGGVMRIATRRLTATDGVSSPVTSRPGSLAELTISDTGQGIPESLLGRIFDPFFTTKEVGKGTGLGLSVAYGIVRQHGGTIRVESTPGQGTTFVIHLPLLESSAPHAVRTHRVEFSGLRIVVADHDHVSRGHAAHLLREEGASVREAENAGEAIRFCRYGEEPVDVIILDILAEEWKKVYTEVRWTAPGVKFVFIGGMRREGNEADDDMETGIATIYRPILREELIEKLRKVMQPPVGGPVSD